ncbi:MAG: SpoIIE family protein phosphatase [Spirochaetota bacterium]
MRPDQTGGIKSKLTSVRNGFTNILTNNRKLSQIEIGEKDFLISQNIIPITKWRLFIVVDKTILFRPILEQQNYARKIGFGAVFAMFISSILFFAYLLKKSNSLAHMISSPIVSLAKSTEHWQSFVHAKEITSSGIEEIDILTGNFLKSSQELSINQSQLLEKNRELDELNENLEEKVQKRTVQLQQSLEQIQTLKQKQDMDYFLISQLLTPLQANSKSDKPLRTRVFLEQQKKIHIRSKKMEIGGDFNFYQQIQIMGRDFLFFVNADAMGKSLQGAGGAIVFGASLKSQVMRYQSDNSQLILPELWLRNVFYDLQDIFSNFDCSMLMSMVIGLIDIQSYTCYYVNSEHPYPVLYRANKASFLSHNHILHKVGTPDTFTSSFSLETVQLVEDDILLLGSDGRDDILVTNSLVHFLKQKSISIKNLQARENPDSKDRTNLNIDETLFLRVVEIAKGDIAEISNIIKSHSQTTDDFSLLSFAIKQKTATSLPPITNEIIKRVSHFYSKKEYSTALSFLSKEFEKSPFHIFDIYLIRLLLRIYKKLRLENQSDTLEYLIYFLNPLEEDFILSRVKKNIKKKKWSIASDFIEILRIRYPNDENYLLLSAQIFYERGMLSKARDAVSLVKVNSESEHSIEIKQLQRMIDKKEKAKNVTTDKQSKYFLKLFDIV